MEITKELYGSIVEYISQKGYSPSTIRAYRSNLRTLLKSGKVLDTPLCAKYLKKYTHPNQRIIVKIINDYCHDNNIDFNMRVPRVKQKPRKIPDILSTSEIKIMVEASPAPYDLMIRCIFGMGSGLRISEAIKLGWNNIRWADWLENREYGVAVLKDTKRGNDRVVNIPNELMKDLYKLAKEKNLLNEMGIPSGLMIFDFGLDTYKQDLFRTNIEQWKVEYVMMAYNSFRYNVLQKCCEPALNKKTHAHMLRHSRATYLYEVEGLPIERISILLGHKDIQTTMIYTRIDPKSTFNMLKDTKVV